MESMTGPSVSEEKWSAMTRRRVCACAPPRCNGASWSPGVALDLLPKFYLHRETFSSACYLETENTLKSDIITCLDLFNFENLFTSHWCREQTEGNESALERNIWRIRNSKVQVALLL